MSNKITSAEGMRSAPIGPGRAIERSKDATVANPDADVPSGNTSTVDITGTAQQLAALEQSLLNQPAIDEARVAAIRLAIEQGNYQVSAQQTAEGLLQLEQALGKLER
jgi:negative regulator of flagellin synthesis FlgM